MNKRIFSWLTILALLLTSLALPALDEEEEEEATQPTNVLYVEADGEQPLLGYTENIEILEVDGFKFKDLNKNGQLDVYEDWREDTEARVNDLLSQMTPENKAAQMLHMTLVSLKESWFNELNVGFVLAYTNSPPARRTPPTRPTRCRR